MSRAFVKELEDAAEPSFVAPRPDKVTMTPGSFARLRARVEAAADPAERASLQELLDTAVVAEPPADRDVVAFGATVGVAGNGRGVSRYTIVDDFESDVAAGRIGAGSPLARALLGARVGETVVWHRPAGDRTLTIRAVAYDG